MPVLTSLADLVRSRPWLRRTAHQAVRLIPDMPWTIHVPELGPLRIRLRRHRWHLWEKFGTGDEFTFEILRRLIRPGDVVYDVGANIGIYSRVMVQWFGASKVIAIEPMTENFELLKANIALAKLEDRIIPYQLALSDVEGEEDLQIDDMTSGTAVLSSVSGGEASVGRREFGLAPLSERVKVTTLDRLIERERLQPPAVVKIDTEGAEVKVLRGADHLLRRHNPSLSIALHGEVEAGQTLQLMDTCGYTSIGLSRAQPFNDEAQEFCRLGIEHRGCLANNNIAAASNEVVMSKFFTDAK